MADAARHRRWWIAGAWLDTGTVAVCLAWWLAGLPFRALALGVGAACLASAGIDLLAIRRRWRNPPLQTVHLLGRAARSFRGES